MCECVCTVCASSSITHGGKDNLICKNLNSIQPLLCSYYVVTTYLTYLGFFFIMPKHELVWRSNIPIRKCKLQNKVFIIFAIFNLKYLSLKSFIRLLNIAGTERKLLIHATSNTNNLVFSLMNWHHTYIIATSGH